MVHENDETVGKFKTLSLSLKRLKTQSHNPHDDDIVHFVHKDMISRCLVFNMFYNLVIQEDHSNNFMFPNWKHLVKQTENGTNSTVSQAFKKFWNYMHKKALAYGTDIEKLSPEEKEIIEIYCIDMMTDGRGVHSGKKKGVQDLGDSELVPQDIIGRCCWLIKAFHTFF